MTIPPAPRRGPTGHRVGICPRVARDPPYDPLTRCRLPARHEEAMTPVTVSWPFPGFAAQPRGVAKTPALRS